MGKIKSKLGRIALLLGAAFLFASNLKCDAFALLGPVQPWMEPTNGVVGAGDIGGPMLLTNEYRWNVPVVTYGFDKSFTDYFGTNGVAAVEGAFQILNNLPPASQLALTNYPFGSQSYNPSAQALFIQDLKSTTLSLLLEHLGLAQPTRNTFVMRQWNPVFIVPPNRFDYQFDWPDWVYPDYISMLNFDPQTWESSFYVNEIFYSAYIIQYGNQNYLQPLVVDPFASKIYPAVADFDLQLGGYYTGLTYDDIGGLVYLLSTNNVNFETLLPDIVGVGTNPNLIVNGAWRPGVEKISFIPQPVNFSGAFLPLTNYFTDTFYSNGVAKQQSVARIISQPDFLFSAGDVTKGFGFFGFTRTGTANWLNNAAANGNANGAGPGVIQPPVQIVFDKFGEQFITDGTVSDERAVSTIEYYYWYPFLPSWGSFDSSTNLPITYPIPQTGTNQMTVRLLLEIGDPANPSNFSSHDFEWKPSSLIGGQFAMQTSTNLTSWVSLFTVTNNGMITTYLVENPKSSSRFYRLNPQ